MWLLESDENREIFEEIKLVWDNSEAVQFEIFHTEMQEGLLKVEKSIAERIVDEQR